MQVSPMWMTRINGRSERRQFLTVTRQVTEFLQIPMYEMTSEEFYSLYMDADKKMLQMFEPLKGPNVEV